MPKSEAEYAAKLKHVCEMRYVQRESRTDVAIAVSKDSREPLTAANVNKWLDAARDLGVVTFDIDASFAIMGEPHERLSNELGRAFRLDEPLVIETAEDSPQDDQADEVHTALANQTGKHLKISANSNVFVAGGRTVLQIVRKISRKRVSKQNVRIDPLSGRNWTGSWQFGGADDLKRPLDADDAAVVLASAFPESGNYYSQIGYPLYAETTQQARVIMREHCAFLPDGRWNWDIPKRRLNRAICGIGALHPRGGHRIMRFLEVYLQEHGATGNLETLIADGTLGSVKLPGKPGKSAPYLSVAWQSTLWTRSASQRKKD
jgi:DNA-binding transcriptional regulator LsrR (DeoR family)